MNTPDAAASTTGGGSVELAATLEQLVAALGSLVTVLSERAAAQAGPAATAGANGGAGELSADSGCGAGGCGAATGAAGGAQLVSETSEAPAATTAEPAGGAAAPSDRKDPKPGTQKGNALIVARMARKYDQDPELAVAMMLAESGGRSRAVGDGGTSFGLFQLHKGGMLTSNKLTPEQAFDPTTNAEVAMKSLRSFQRKTGKTGGQLAAASQRPADPQGYARKVEELRARAAKLLRGLDY